MARLFDSVAPEVMTVSFSLLAPTSFATRSRAASTASSACQPKAWLRDAALPKCCVKYGSISWRTRGSTGVVEW